MRAVLTRCASRLAAAAPRCALLQLSTLSSTVNILPLWVDVHSSLLAQLPLQPKQALERIRSVLDSHVLDVAGSAAERGDGLDPSIKLLQESVAKVDACAADAEVISAEVGQS